MKHSSIDQLTALNDQIVAITRARIPLDRGLHLFADDLPGRLRQLARALAEDLRQGIPLSQALAAHPEVPAVYRAVVEAGERCGKLPAAAERVSERLHRLAHLRRNIGWALVYPLGLAALAAGLTVLTLVYLTPRSLEAVESVVGEGLPSLAPWRWAIRGAPVLAIVGSIGLAAGAGVLIQGVRGIGGWFDRLPLLGRLRRLRGAITFCEVLLMLVENHLPLEEALPLAGNCSGDPQLAREAEQLAAAVGRGESGTAVRSPAGSRIPGTVLGILRARSPSVLRLRLERSLTMLHRRAERLARRAQGLLPMLLTLVIGASITLFYAAAALGPWLVVVYELVYRLGGGGS